MPSKGVRKHVMTDKQAGAGRSLPLAVNILGYAGLIPPAAAVLLALEGGPWGWISQAGGFAYAALIFSFLGGVWWGQRLQSGQSGQAERRSAGWGAFILAVLPSLLGVALFIPWTLGWAWPGPSLVWLGLLIALSPFVDRWLGLGGVDWMTLRWRLSLGLGALSIALGMVAMEPVGAAA